MLAVLIALGMEDILTILKNGVSTKCALEHARGKYVVPGYPFLTLFFRVFDEKQRDVQAKRGFQEISLQVTIKTNLLAELKYQAPN